MRGQLGNAKTILLVLLFGVFVAGCLYKAPIATYQSKLAQMYADSLNWISLQVAGESGTSVSSDAKELGVNGAEALMREEDGCHGPLPKHGKRYLYAESAQNLKQQAKLWVNNAHLYPLWITLFDVDTLDPVASFYVEPSKHSKLQLPVGDYEIEVQSGSAWCSFTDGFENAALIEPDILLSIVPNEVEHISFSSFGSTPSDLMFSDVEPAATYSGSGQKIRGTGSLKLEKVDGGHYAVQGSINQQPVFFLIDTGATGVSVPHDFAKHAGIKGCQKVKSKTANGVVDSCLGMANELEIGQFLFNDVEVAYSKGMPADTFLLGMSVLSQFKMVQQGEQMTLSR